MLRTPSVANNQDLRRLVAILENSHDFVATTDTMGRVTYINASGRAIRGLGPDDDIEGTTLQDHYPAWACEKIQNEAVPAALANGTWVGETAVIGKDGRDVPIDHTVIAHRDAEGRLQFFSSLMHDISNAKAAAAALRESEARMRLLADALPVHVAFIDSDYRYLFVNAGYEIQSGIPRSQILGKSMAEMIGAEGFSANLPYLERASRGETQMYERDRVIRGMPHHFLVKIIPQFDEQQRLIGYHLVHQDVTDHKLEHRRLSKLVRADALTGLLNRAGFETALDEAMQKSRDERSAMGLLYLDIDRFKSINDQRGHPAGDKLLRAFAARLIHAVRAADIVARLGGDEFVVIAERLRSTDDVRSIARKILRAMQPEVELGGVTFSITVSIGIAVYTGQAIQAAELIDRADGALYRAKNAGRNRYDLDDPLETSDPAHFEFGEAFERTLF